MNSEYCFPGRATSPGTSNYYCVRMAPASLRNHLALIFEWQWELHAIYHRCSDPGVALTKLQWYREELPKALNKQSQHPLLKKLAETIHAFQLPTQALLDMGKAVEMEIQGVIPKDISALKSYGELGNGTLLQLITQICSGDEQELTCARQLGAHTRLVEIIQNIGHDFQLGSCFLPLDLIEQQGLQPNQLVEAEHEAALCAILASLSIQAKEWHASAIEGLSDNRHPALIPALALAASRNSLLAKLKNSNYTVLTQRISLAPLTKLWVSWRIYRQYQ